MIVSTSQQPVTKLVNENKECILDVLEKTKDSDWVLTPEGSLSGYRENQTHTHNNPDYAPALKEVENYLIKNQRNMLLGTGHVESDGLPWNQIRVYNKGQFGGAYAKRLPCMNMQYYGGELFSYCTGDQPYYYYLDNKRKIIASSLICNDIWAFPKASPMGNPYFYRQFKADHVQVVFCAVNCNNDHGFDQLIYEWHENHLRLFSREFDMYTIVSGATTSMDSKEEVNYTQCPSGIIGPDGEWIEKCKDNGADIATAELKL